MIGSPGAPTPSPPWWAHVLIGAIILAVGAVLAIVGPNPEVMNTGLVAVGSGLTFLGVGSGVAASS